jgi:cyclopropane-fatty-acyl-phospholipid synthase
MNRRGQGPIYERFCQTWRFHLIASEMTFIEGHRVVFRIQLARHKDAVPLTRDDLYPAEERWVAADAAE